MILAETDGDDLLHHLLVDMLWKVGIVAALAILVLIAATIIWKHAR